MTRKKQRKTRKSSSKKDWKLIGSVFLQLAFYLFLIPLIYTICIFALKQGGLLQEVKMDIIQFFIPGFIALLAVFFLNRFLLYFANERLRGFIQLILGLCVWMMCINGVLSVYRSTATQTHVQRLSEASQKQYPDYIHLQQIDADTSRLALHAMHELISKRHGADIKFEMFVAYPVKGYSQLYYGYSFQETHDYTFMSEERMRKLYGEFILRSMRRIPHHAYNQVSVLQRLQPSNEREQYLQALQNEGMIFSNPDNIVIYTRTTDNAFPSYSQNILYALLEYGICLVLLGLFFVFAPFNERSRQENQEENRKEYQEWKAFLLDKQHLPITLPAVIIILHFIVMTLSGVHPMASQSEQLLQWGASNAEMVWQEGRWWTLITSIFTHAGLPHIAGNVIMYALAVFFLLPLLRPRQILSVFLLSGFVGALACSLFTSNTFLGASGGVMGLLGAILMLSIISKKLELSRKSYLIGSLFFIGINLLFSFFSYVSMAAHVTGLIAGMVTAAAIEIYERQQNRDNESL